MKYRSRLVAFILCIAVLIPCIVGCSSTPKGPSMWVVTGEDGQKIYLFGSIHIGSEDMYPLDERIMNAFNECDHLAVEYDIVSSEKESENWTDEQLMQYTSQFVYTNGDTIEDHIDSETYELAKNFLTSRGMYDEMLDHFVPAYWSNLITSIVIEQSPYSTDLGVDRHFINAAHEMGKTVLDVESEQFQTELLLSFSDEYYATSIYQSVSQADSAEMSYGYYLDIWSRGRDDLMTFMNYDAVGMFSFEEQNSDAIIEANKIMLDDRNVNMAKVADGYLKDGKKVFFVVGAAHMCGEKGIPALLENMGYKVEKA